jgi:hypothetical protein
MVRVPKQFAPIVEGIYGRFQPRPIETLRLNVRYQDDKIKAKQLLYIIAIQINNHSKIPNPIWQSLKQYTQTLSQRSAEL